MEIWKDVFGYEGIYEISSLGRLKSLQRQKQGRFNSIRTLKEKILKHSFDNDGYCQFVLSNDGFKKTIKSYRLVAEAFIPNPDNKPQVNHINGIKTDNRVENLEWCTNKENQIHAYSIGLKFPKTGEQVKTAKLKEKEVLKIRSSELTYRELSLKYKVSVMTICKIKNRKTWNHI
jgi:hypothetical protein